MHGSAGSPAWRRSGVRSAPLAQPTRVCTSKTGMWFFDLVDFVTGHFTVPILLALVTVLAVGCVLAPRMSDEARRASVAAGFNPLWLLVPFGGLFFTAPLGADMIGLEYLTALSKIPSKIWE